MTHACVEHRQTLVLHFDLLLGDRIGDIHDLQQHLLPFHVDPLHS